MLDCFTSLQVFGTNEVIPHKSHVEKNKAFCILSAENPAVPGDLSCAASWKQLQNCRTAELSAAEHAQPHSMPLPASGCKWVKNVAPRYLFNVYSIFSLYSISRAAHQNWFLCPELLASSKGTTMIIMLWVYNYILHGEA